MSMNGFGGAESLPELVEQIGRLQTDSAEQQELIVEVDARLTELGVRPFG